MPQRKGFIDKRDVQRHPNSLLARAILGAVNKTPIATNAELIGTYKTWLTLSLTERTWSSICTWVEVYQEPGGQISTERHCGIVWDLAPPVSMFDVAQVPWSILERLLEDAKRNEPDLERQL